MKVHESDTPRQALYINQNDDLYDKLEPGESVFVYDARSDKPSVKTFSKPLTLTSIDENKKICSI